MKKLLNDCLSKGLSRSGLDSRLKRIDARRSAGPKVAWGLLFGPPCKGASARMHFELFVLSLT